MIKRSGALFIALLYLVTVSGFALNLHYCGSFLMSVNINSTAKNCGMFAGSKMKCCKNKHVEVKVKDAHQAESTSFLVKTFAFATPLVPFAAYYNFGSPSTFINGFANKAPPNFRQSSTPVFLKNCTFRI